MISLPLQCGGRGRSVRLLPLLRRRKACTRTCAARAIRPAWEPFSGALSWSVPCRADGMGGSAKAILHAAAYGLIAAFAGLERSNSEACIDRTAVGVTDDPTGPSIEDDSQVHSIVPVRSSCQQSSSFPLPRKLAMIRFGRCPGHRYSS